MSIRESLSTLKAKSTRSPKPLLVVQGEPEVKSIEENKSNEIPENHYGSLIHDPPVRSINSSNSPALPAENEKNPFAINSILSRAEGLLSRVKGATASMPPAIPIRQALPSTVSAEVPQKVRTALLANPDHDSAQIDWLIRGVTEAYDAEPEYDDDVIRHLIKTGGDPPSQLSFPSLYATNQKVMSELSAVRKLRIQLQVFQCYSSKFGLRKKGSYLLFRLPVGCKVADDQPRQLLLPLPELDNGDNYSSSKSAKRYTDKSDHLKVFFVGSVECRKDVSVDLLLTDQVMQCWLSGKEEGVLRIELYSYVSILKTSLAGKTTEPVLFGSANIPLNGLLCNENLDTLCRIDMDADLDTMAVVANRLTALRIPPLQRVAHAIDSSKIATLTARLSLVSHLVPIPVGSPTVLTYPVTNEEVGQIDQVGDPLDTALHYVPSEEGKDNGEFSSVEFFEDLRSNPRHLKLEVVNQKIQQSVTHNSVIGAHYGIAFHCITGIKLPVEFWVDKMSTIINGKLIPFISLDYKLSTK